MDHLAARTTSLPDQSAPGRRDVDPEIVCEQAMRSAVQALGGACASLLLRDDDGVVATVATLGDDGAAIATGAASVVGSSIRMQQPLRELQVHAGPRRRHRMSLPILVGAHGVGAVVVDGPRAVSDDTLAAVHQSLVAAASRIESAVSFGDVRDGATAEERRRLAREIHDGVAQDVASLGYIVDDLRRHESGEQQQTGLSDLRRGLTRILAELRLSVADLRTERPTSTGLGCMLADFVRDVGDASNTAVHVSLEESPTRLGREVETELLHIGKEAVANAGRHAQARNLWMRCRVEPPFADIRVDDDGIGSAAPRDGHFGLPMLSERADRINAVLSIGNRPGGGTSVRAVLLPSGSPELRVKLGGSHALQRAARR